MNNYIEKDLSQFFVYSWVDPTEQIHSRYTNEEIATLWSKLYVINNVDLILITIYTGLRPTELLEITTDNVHLDEQYMIGGMKTEAGTDRTIPIADKFATNKEPVQSEQKISCEQQVWEPLHLRIVCERKFQHRYEQTWYAASPT